MSNNKKKPYKVGYQKPPEHTQFKPGQSGSRNGRPKGSVSKELDKVLSELLPVKGGKKRKAITLLLTQLRNAALTGNLKAASLFIHLMKNSGKLVPAQAETQPTFDITDEDEDILADFLKRNGLLKE
jgi:hypothetical protein